MTTEWKLIYTSQFLRSEVGAITLKYFVFLATKDIYISDTSSNMEVLKEVLISSTCL